MKQQPTAGVKLRRALLILGVAAWLAGSYLLVFGELLVWRLAGAVVFGTGIGLMLWSGFRGQRRP